MNHSTTIEDLRRVIALKDLPEEHLRWLIDHSEYYEVEDGNILVKTGEPIDHMWILLEGKVDFYLNKNGQLVYYFSFQNDDITGGVGGLLPYSRMKSSPGTSYAVGKVRAINLHKSHFPELEQLNPDLIQRLISYMTERARIFATTQMQQEKVSALGKLAAGIAHELNNPAAAINRISSELNKRLKRNIELTEGLIKQSIEPSLMHSIREMVRSRESNSKPKMTALKRMQREDELNDWLMEKGIKGSYEIAGTLTEAGFSVEDLNKINSDCGTEACTVILEWLENLLTSEAIIKDLDDASGRITVLVDAIKSHVHMDRSGALNKTNIHHDIETTLTLLGYKLREKNITVLKNFTEHMPEVEAYTGELNQVWTNIIDNSVYALSQNGELKIETSYENKKAVIYIIDNGAGIPKEIQSRIFDPFFTTKKMGEGTGIGLDIVHTVIKRHSGEIKVNSVPGRTEFTITIPISQPTIAENKKDETPVHSNN